MDRLEAKKEPATTKLIIGKSSGAATNKDIEVSAEMRNLYIARARPDNPYAFYSLSDLRNTLRVEILMRTDDGLKKVALPADMLQRLAEYLRVQQSLGPDFDCTAFAYFLNGIQGDPKDAATFLQNWSIHPFDADTIRVGDTIMIAQETQMGRPDRAVHFAVYLGDGLYLSKFGTSGKPIVTGINEMQALFAGNAVYRVNPSRK